MFISKIQPYAYTTKNSQMENSHSNYQSSLNFKGKNSVVEGIGKTVFYGIEKVCPFGESLQRYWDLLPQISSKYQEMLFDKEILYSIEPVALGSKIANGLPQDVTTILDPFCGGGGSSIGFALAGKKVMASDLNPNHVSISNHNAKVNGVNNILFEEKDALEVVGSTQADAIYLAPPWGGVSYNRSGAFSLDNLGPSGMFGKPLISQSLDRFKHVLVSVPPNIDNAELNAFGFTFEMVTTPFGKSGIATVHFIQK